MGTDDLRWLASTLGADATAVVTALRDEPGLVVDDDLLVERFGLKRRTIEQTLWPAIELGMLVKRRTGQDITYHLGTMPTPDTVDEPAAAIAPPANTAAATARHAEQPSAKAKRAGNPKSARLPKLDLASIGPVRKDVRPPDIHGRGRSIYTELINSLTEPGMSRGGIPIAYRAAISHAALTLGKQSGRKYTVRQTSPETCGIWRME